MRYIDIAVNGGEMKKILDAKSFPVILTDGNVNDICLRFTLSDEWSSFGSICAVFNGSGQVKTVLVTDNQCLLPWECTQTAGGEAALTLEGKQYDGVGKILRSMTTKRFTLGRIYDSDTVSDDISVEPTPALANQVLAAIANFNTAENARAAAETSRASAESARAAAEASRASAESARVTAEANRASSLASAIALAEAAAETVSTGLNASNIAYTGVSGITADNVKSALDELSSCVSGLAGITKATSWADIQMAVRSGLAAKMFAAGDQLTVARGNQTLVFDVIGIDAETPSDSTLTHSLTLQLHDCFANIQFDASEAMFYCGNGLTAGTYHFTLPAGYDTAHGGGKTLQFTLTQNIPAAGQIVFPWTADTSSLSVKISTYASAESDVAIETDIAVSEGSGGTELGASAGGSVSMNNIDRIRYGSNSWSDSAVRKWLNSSANTGEWWSAGSVFDRPPLNAGNRDGFLKDMDSKFLAVLGNVKKTTVSNQITGGGAVISDEKVFLLSRSEIYGGNDTDVSEGDPYEYYSDYSELDSAGMQPDGNRIKYLNGSARYWWLRTCEPVTTHFVRYGNIDGKIFRASANAQYGAAPAVCIV